jgi:hypothetical protein
VRFISVTADLAVASARAEFADGRVFEDVGDATPKNVNRQVAPHFMRCAATRAKARALKDALDLSAYCALEEIGEEGE